MAEKQQDQYELNNKQLAQMLEGAASSGRATASGATASRARTPASRPRGTCDEQQRSRPGERGTGGRIASGMATSSVARRPARAARPSVRWCCGFLAEATAR